MTIALQQALRSYLTERRSLGWELSQPAAALAQFVAFLAAHDATYITTALALRWAINDASPPMWARRLKDVRLFAEYLHGIDPRHDVPARGLLPHAFRRRQPYIYSEEQLLGFVRRAASFPGWSPLRRATLSTLFGLLSASGLRSGEAYRLDLSDVDLVGALLHVRLTKFKKSRIVPIHASVVASLRRYLRVRRDLAPRDACDRFLVTERGRGLTTSHVRPKFLAVCEALGIRKPGMRRGARLCDFRHTFIVRTVLGWHRSGVDVGPRMPVLSTYVGHARVSNTYWYLTATPELLAAAGRRLEHALGALP